MEILTTKGVQFAGGLPKVMGARSYKTLAMKTENSLHISRTSQPQNPENVVGGFAAALTNALGKVEQLDVRNQKLTAQAVYNPDSVDAHNLIIAGEKARFALNLTKTVADGMIRAYKEVTAPR